MDHRMNEMVYTLKRSDIRVFSALAKETPGCISLTLGEPEFDTPQVIEEEVMTAFEHHETHYIPNSGAWSLREKAAAFENQYNGRAYTKENVIITAGASEGLFLACLGLINPGEEVILPVPAYPAYEEDVKAARGVPVHLDTEADGFQISREKLEACITPRTKAVILNSPNNPTGIVYSEESLRNVRDVVKGRNIFVILDEVYRQLCYGEKAPSFPDEDLEAQTIVVQSFSKPYAMTGWRMGYLCGDEAVIERLALLHQFMITSTPSLFQRAAERALEYDPSPFVSVYAKRRRHVLEELEKTGLSVVEPEGAFYVFPSIRCFGMSSDLFCRRMIQEEGLAAIPGSAFGTEGYIRLSYCVSDEVLTEGMNRLKKFVKKLEEEGRG